MPTRFVARAILFSSAFAALACHAAEPDVEATEPVASHHLFTSWFATKPAKTEAVVDTNEAPRGAAPTSRTSELIVNALGLLGINYRLGGNTPTSGFDCSGMVRYVFQNAIGLSLPRRAEEISHVGAKISKDELKPGDLVFYKTLKKTFSHVGIYLGDNRFIHAPSTGGAVRIEDMSEHYWVTRFTGARRVDS